jgi:DNA polymerase-3 subunit gamma/tau
LKEGGASGAPTSAPAPSRPAGPSVSGTMALATSQAQPQPRSAPAPDAAPILRLRRFEDVVAMAGEQREVVLKRALERDVHLVRFEEGHIEFSLTEGASRTVANDLSRALQQWTGQRWMVVLSSDPGAPTLHHQAESAERQRKEGAANHPLVQAVLAKFPGAQIVNVVDRSEKAAADATTALDPVGLEGLDPDSDDDL